MEGHLKIWMFTRQRLKNVLDMLKLYGKINTSENCTKRVHEMVGTNSGQSIYGPKKEEDFRVDCIFARADSIVVKTTNN